jgi:hypothetical protein
LPDLGLRRGRNSGCAGSDMGCAGPEPGCGLLPLVRGW